jgi:hypothetical protein
MLPCKLLNWNIHEFAGRATASLLLAVSILNSLHVYGRELTPPDVFQGSFQEKGVGKKHTLVLQAS